MAKGGKRENSGRKPKAVTIAKRRLVENKIDEAEASFAFMVSVRDNPKEPISQRTAAAIWIYEAVYGKSKQPTEQSGELVIRIVRDSVTPSRTTPSATSNQDASAAV